MVSVPETPMAEDSKNLDQNMNVIQVPPSLWTTHRDGEVLLRLSKHGPGHETPMTIPELFQESASRFGVYPALASKNGQNWDTLSFSQYYEACRKAAKAFMKLGLERFHGVGIMGFNSVEWLIAAVGAILAGGLCVGIYATNSSEACQYVIINAKVDILLVENDQQLQKILSIPPSALQSLKAIIQYKQPLKHDSSNLYSWDDFLKLGSNILDTQLDRVILSQKANQCAVLIYTSGTVGHPMGVMLSHDNITWMAGAMVRELGLNNSAGKQEMVVSYLPLSHIATQMVDIWIPIKIGALIFFAQPDALRGTLVSTLQEVKPTAFLGVPRIWEKMHDTIRENVAKSSGLRKKAFAWAKIIGLKVNTKRMLGKSELPVNYRMAKALVFSKVRSSLGLDRCHTFLSGAAPLPQETSEFFLSLDIPIGEIYGMSESSGPHSVSTKTNYRVLSCGKILSGCKNMLYQQNKEGIGEVCMWGRHVFMGYLDKEEATREAIDKEGWLHSGDMGRVDNQGYLFITGRIKEILITAGGENVPPIPIETLVKEKIPIISNAMLVGDKAKFLSMLLTLKCDVDPTNGEPLDKLTSEAANYCRVLGSTATTVSDIVKLRDPLIYTAIQNGIDAVNREATSDAQRVRKWIILEKDFSILGGELDSGYWTTRLDGEVRLRLGQDRLETEPPGTVHDMVMDAATKFTHYIALGSKYKKGWHLLTYIDYYEECRRAAKAFLKVGLERFHGVGIMGFNSEEWVIANIGAIMAGGVTVGILTTNSPKACQAIAEVSEMDVFVVDTDRQLQKIIQIQGYLKHLKAIIQYKEELQETKPNVYSWKGFLDLADGISDERLNQVIDSQKSNQCCTLIYNLGASGTPKVMMLSHDNILWTTAATVQSLSYKYPPEGQEVIVSYLPLSHMGPQIFDIWVTMCVAGTLYFPAPEIARMSGTTQAPGTGFLLDMLREVQPTTFYGIPWVWERMLDSLQSTHLDSTAFRRRVHKWAMRLGLNANKKRMLGPTHPPLCFGVAKMLTYDPARKFLGLSKCEQLLNMGQGLPSATLDFFLSLDMPIFEVYGLSQCTGIHCLSSQQAFRLLSSGKHLPNSRTKVEKENEDGIGHICVWGRNVFMGYLNDKESTSKMIDSQGWMHTGDLGFLDADNFLYVVGNESDAISLSSGETINPCPIEERVKMHIPIVRYAMVVGQDAPYLCVLLTLKCQINVETGEPRSTLTSEAVAFCRSIHSQATWLSDVLDGRDPVITKFIQEGIDATNREASSEAEMIVKWTILDNDFSVTTGELGVMTRLRRTVVAKMYQKEIQKLYEEKPSSS